MVGIQQAEYIRHGMDFDKVWNNVNRFLDETHPLVLILLIHLIV